MADLLSTSLLIDSVPRDDIGCPNMSPSTCVLGDGTALMTVTVRGPNGGREVVRIFHVGHDGTLLGETQYANDGWHGKDTGLVALDGTKALLVVNNIQYASDGDTAPASNDVVSLDCSGAAPAITGVTTSPYVQKFTSNNSQCRFSFYIPATGQAVVYGNRSVAVYKDGAAQGFLATNNYIYGWWPHPSDPTKFAVQRGNSSVTPRYAADEYTVAPDGSITVAPVDGYEAFADNNWLFCAGSPYTHPTPFLNASDPDYQNWDLLRGDMSVMYEWDGPGPAWYQNYTGSMYPVGEKNFVTCYEWSQEVGGDERTRYFPGVLDVDYSTDPPTHTEIVFDYGSTAHGLSLNYGSWAADARNGLMAIACNVTSSYGPDVYSSMLYLLKVKSKAQGALKVEVSAGEFVTVAQKGTRTEGRLKVWTPMGWCWEWFESDGPVKRWKLKVKTEAGWSDCGWFTNGERAE